MQRNEEKRKEEERRKNIYGDLFKLFIIGIILYIFYKLYKNYTLRRICSCYSTYNCSCLNRISKSTPATLLSIPESMPQYIPEKPARIYTIEEKAVFNNTLNTIYNDIYDYNNLNNIIWNYYIDDVDFSDSQKKMKE